MKRNRPPRLSVRIPSGFAGFRFPPEVILLAVGLVPPVRVSYRDLEELLAERHRGRSRHPLSMGAAAHALDDRGGPGRLALGRVIDVYLSQRRDVASARTLFTTIHGDPAEVITDRAPALANVIEDLVPAAWHDTGQYQNNRVECDHGRLKARLGPMRGLETHRTASVVIRGRA